MELLVDGAGPLCSRHSTNTAASAHLGIQALTGQTHIAASVSEISQLYELKHIFLPSFKKELSTIKRWSWTQLFCRSDLNGLHAVGLIRQVFTVWVEVESLPRAPKLCEEWGFLMGASDDESPVLHL